MATLNAQPQSVDILAYAGDTLAIRITAPASLVSGMSWHAGIKTVRSDNSHAATFIITPPTVAGGPALLTLTSDDSMRLANTTSTSYNGFWDCQISADGHDPVKTLVQGKITIALDVTRTS